MSRAALTREYLASTSRAMSMVDEDSANGGSPRRSAAGEDDVEGQHAELMALMAGAMAPPSESKPAGGKDKSPPAAAKGGGAGASGGGRKEGGKGKGKGKRRM